MGLILAVLAGNTTVNCNARSDSIHITSHINLSLIRPFTILTPIQIQNFIPMYYTFTIEVTASNLVPHAQLFKTIFVFSKTRNWNDFFACLSLILEQKIAEANLIVNVLYLFVSPVSRHQLVISFLVIPNNCLRPGAPVYEIFVSLRYFPIAVTDGGGILSRENSTLISLASSIHLGRERRIFVKEDEN